MTQTELEQLGRNISAAFPEHPRPQASQLLAQSDLSEDEFAQLRRGFEGRTWRDLDASFLAHHWAQFNLLSDAAFCYFLPALLTHSLLDFDDANVQIDHTVALLTPDWWQVYKSSEDPRLRARMTRLSPAQYDIVCSFLGMVLSSFAHQHDRGFAAAQALKWGWNQAPHPAVEECRRFYATLHSFDYPAAQDPDVQAVVESIQSAFAATPYPEGNVLCASRQGYEPPEIELEFHGLDWRTLHPDFLGFHDSALSFFAPAAFRYFLPAYLLADLLAAEIAPAVSHANPVFHLTHGLAPEVYDELMAETARFLGEVDMSDLMTDIFLADVLTDAQDEEPQPSAPGLQAMIDQLEREDWEAEYAWRLEKLSGFNRAERQAIIAYLRHKAERSEGDRPTILNALARYWEPSLEE